MWWILCSCYVHIDHKKMNKPQLLPMWEDIQKLNSFLTTEIDKCAAVLKSDLDVRDSWQRLSRATLTGIIVFNHKRDGEAERMLISEYSQRDVKPHFKVFHGNCRLTCLFIPPICLLASVVIYSTHLSLSLQNLGWDGGCPTTTRTFCKTAQGSTKAGLREI